jgi:threonine/homoserine/homoserine lactone efflux protein
MIDHGVGWLTRAKVQRRLERLTGVVLIAFGIRLATESR